MKKGFTLLELLIVVSILSLLTAIAVIILNPTELLARARDGKRMNDLNKIANAINLYLATASSTDLTEGISGNYASVTVSGAICPFTGTQNCGSGPPPIFLCCSTNTSRNIDGSGWISINLEKISGGSPIAVLPVDPINNNVYYYTYVGDESKNTFELNTKLESEKYRGKMINDGGDRNNCSNYTENTCYYEIGNDPGLDLLLNGIIFP